MNQMQRSHKRQVGWSVAMHDMTKRKIEQKKERKRKEKKECRNNNIAQESSKRGESEEVTLKDRWRKYKTARKVVDGSEWKRVPEKEGGKSGGLQIKHRGCPRHNELLEGGVPGGRTKKKEMGEM